MKEYVENMKECEEVCQYIGFGTSISIWALGLQKILSTTFIYSLWDFEKGVTLSSPPYKL